MQSPSFNQSSASPVRLSNVCRSGFTMIELMVAAGITLVLFVALLQAFKTIGDSVTTARATMEMSGQLRSVTHRLREDLKGVTVPMRPWTRPGAGEGYFEYLEGPSTDERTPGNPDTAAGDLDDVLMFTARSDAEPFVGRFNGNVIESRVAEIIWWNHFDPTLDDQDASGTWDPGEQRTLHRRVLLVRPDLNNNSGVAHAATTPAAMRQFYNDNDVSVRPYRDATNTLIGLAANSLSDLTKRENRFAHYPVLIGPPVQFAAPAPGVGFFPFAIDMGANSPTSLVNLVQYDNSEGQDVIASNLVAFDVRVYDPLAPVFADSSNVYALVPGDNEYETQRTGGAPVIGRGAFVDLNYAGNNTISQFSGPPDSKSKLTTTPTYCTWSFHYEHDGIDQDLIDGPDQGTNNLDDDQENGVDDIGERETSPPYPRPLRGLKVTIRMLEPDSEEVQQFSVVKDFTPE